MNIRNPFVIKSLTSIADQIIISGLNFIIGLALIRYATKENFGLYSQLFAVALLATTLLDSVIGTALTTICGRLRSDQTYQLLYRAIALQFVASGALAIIAGIGVYIFDASYEVSSNNFILALSFFAYILTLGIREYCRTAFFILSKPELTLTVDFAFFVVTFVGVIVIILNNSMTVENILFILSIANFSGFYYKLKILTENADRHQKIHIYIADVKNLWELSRWAFIGSIVGWVGNNGYIYLASTILGVAALADMNAARLVLIPISIVGVAWTKVARPVMGQIIAISDWRELRIFMYRSIIAIEIFAILYSIIIFKTFPWMSENFFGEKYGNIIELIILWAIYYSIYVARNVGTTLLISYGEFRMLFFQGMVSLPALLIACIFLMPIYGIQGALYAMIIVELWDMLVSFLYMLPRAKRLNISFD